MFHFEKHYHLQNEIAELVLLSEIHQDELFKVSNDKTIWEHFTEKGYGKNNFETYFNNAILNHKNNLEYPFVIKDLRTNRIAGMTRIYNIDNELRNTKIGHTWLGLNFHGTGLNKACKYLLFEFLFEQLHFERIGFGASATNQKSISAMQSVGCKIEGALRGFLPIKGSNQRESIVLLSILKEEWLTNVKANLANKLNKYL